MTRGSLNDVSSRNDESQPNDILDAFADPGRTNLRTMEDPDSPDTVVPSQCSGRSRSRHPSRPGPVFGLRERVFQVPISGKYNPVPFDRVIPDFDTRLASSDDWTTPVYDDDLPSCSYRIRPSPRLPLTDADPGRMNLRITEDPDSPDTVVPSQCSGCSRSRHPSRPGPVFGSREGVLHHASSGMYLCSAIQSTAPDAPSLLSRTQPSMRSQAYGVSSPPLSDSIACTSQKIRFYYQNVRGLKSKVDDFFLSCQDSDYDIIMLTETWLDDSIKPVQLFGNAFEVFSTHRNARNSRRTVGGGVLIAVRKTLDSTGCIEAAAVNLEQVFVTIRLKTQKLFVGCFYLPSEKRFEHQLVEDHISCIETVTGLAGPCDNIVVMGDYNQSNLVWKPLPGNRSFVDPLNTHTRCRMEKMTHELLLDGVARNCLHQCNLVHNHQNRILDLVFVNDGAEHTATFSAPDCLVPLDRYHPALVFDLFAALDATFEDTNDPFNLDFRKTDFCQLIRSLDATDWTAVLETTDVDVAVVHFAAVIRELLARHTPYRRPPRKPAWGNAHLRELKTRRAAALDRYTQHRGPMTKAVFNAASSRYKSYNKRCYKDYIRKTQGNLRRNPSQFWSFAKSKYKENGLPSTMVLGESVATTNDEKCTLFAQHFASVFKLPSSAPTCQEYLEFIPRDIVDVDVFFVTKDMLKRASQKLNSSNAPGPDGIPSKILKRCLEQLSTPLLKIFNLSLQQSKFPTEWKKSVMFPVYKKGAKRLVENYRGITSLCAGSKLLEIVVGEVISFNCRSFICPEQHGFMPGRSVTSNLMEFTNFCIENMAAGRQVDAVYTDLKAAFDRLDHNIVLQKFSKLGFSSRMCLWLESFLKERIIQVKIGTSLSAEFSNGSGVAQGSNLGPQVFNVFFNDSNALFDDSCKLLYADDFKIFLAIDNLADCYRLQSRLDKFSRWCDVNRMELSVEKCTTISFHRKTRREVFTFDYSLNGHVLERLEVVKDLGIQLDERLSFRQHQSAIIDKANRQLGFLFRMAYEFDDPLCLRSLYFALVRSHLEFSAIIWSPYHQSWIDRIERIQKKFVWYACRKMPWNDPMRLPSYEARCNLLGIETLENRRFISKAVFAAKILTAEIDCPNLLTLLNTNISSRNLRPRTDQVFLSSSLARTDYLRNSPVRSISDVFNDTYRFFEFHEPVTKFHAKLRAEFRDNTQRHRQRR